ncbi:MAG: FAD:protein FMN transferase [Desulforhopalus sp.]
MNEMKSGANTVSRRNFLRIVAVAGAAAGCWQLGLFGSGKKLQVARRSQPIMGTVLNLTVYGPDRDQCEEALTNTITTMQTLEGRLSRHMATSELSQLNRNASLTTPGRDLLNVLTLAQEISRKSSGAFDITILPLLELYEEGREKGELPDAASHAMARKLIGYDKLAIGPGGIRLAEPGMGISLDGIGKGYIVDRGVDSLSKSGFHNVCVEAGGDLMVSGLKVQDQPWRIGIRNPRPEQRRKFVTLAVSDKAVATSGDYFQPFTPDLKNHHILDPYNGYSPPELASCTVTAPNAAMADGLATTIMVLGKDKALDLIEPMQGCEAYMVTKDLQEFNTTGFFS